MKIFGREPAVLIGLIEAGLALAVLTVWDLSGEQVAVVMAVVLAVFGVIQGIFTTETLFGAVLGLTKAVLALMIGFGFEMSPEVVAGVVAFVSAFLATVVVRPQVSPAEVPSLQ